MPTEISALERPQMAVQGLLSGDVDAAWRSILQPQELTPEQRDAYLKKLGIKGSVYENMFQGLTNPLLIASLILSHKFPPAVGDAILKVSSKVGGLTSRLPFLGKWMSKEAWFRGTEIPGLLDDVAIEVMDFKKRHGIKMGQVLTEFQKSMGRLPDQREQVQIAAWLDGLHKPLRGFAGKNGKIRIGSGSSTSVLPEVGVLAPGLEAKMSPAALQLAKNMRGVLDETWDEVFGKLENRKQILRALAAQKKAGFWDTTSDMIEQFLQNPKKMADYFPRRMLHTSEDFQRMVQLLTAGGSSKRYAASASKKASEWATSEVMKRQFATLPSWQDLALLGDAVNPEAVRRLEDVAKAKVLHQARLNGVREGTVEKMKAVNWGDLTQNYTKYLGEGEAAAFAGAMADAAPQQYSLRLMPVLSSYTHTLAGTFGWTVKGYGDKITAQLTNLKSLAKAGNPYAKARADVLESTLIPLAMGRQTFQKAVKAQAWAQSMTELAAKMDSPSIRNILGDSLAGTMKNHLENSKGAFNLLGLQQKASAYFYLSTLGMNPGSALRNQLQNVLTLGPVLGWRTAAEGMAEALRKSHKYFSLRMGPRALSHEAAVAAAYPEFGKAGLAAGAITDEVVEQALRNAHDISIIPSKATTLAEKISRGMMSMFTASETVNRVASFEAGMIHARRAGMATDAAIPFARDIVRKTQFILTPTSGPLALANAGPIIKQFTYFPSKMLEFATSTAFTLGSGAIDPKTGKEMNILGYNPGTAARMVAGSIIAMELGDAMGLDLRSSLVSSALPTLQEAREGSPFGALPVVPPGLQVGGSAAYGVATGDWDALRHSLPLLVPGGITVAKGAGFLPPALGGAMGGEVARVLERSYADYSSPGPDGRIAVYSGKGTFRGYYNAWDIIKYGMGIRGGDLDREQQALTMLTKNRDQIIQSKRDYMDARFRNSAREANQVARQFEQRYGFKLPVSEQDMAAMQTRRHVTRLEQLIRTTPAGPARQTLIESVQTTLGANAQQLLGVDPALLGSPRPVAEKTRFGTRRAAGSSMPRFDAQTDMSPMDSVNPRTIGRQPGVSDFASP